MDLLSKSLLEIEEACLARVRLFVGPSPTVAVYPDDPQPEQFQRLASGDGCVLLRYSGTPIYEALNGSSYRVQRQIFATVGHRSLKGPMVGTAHHGLYPLVEQVMSALSGYMIPGTRIKLSPQADNPLPGEQFGTMGVYLHNCIFQFPDTFIPLPPPPSTE